MVCFSTCIGRGNAVHPRPHLPRAADIQRPPSRRQQRAQLPDYEWAYLHLLDFWYGSL